MTVHDRIRHALPILDWGRRYDRDTAGADLLAALIVTIMLIPQSLAYAMLAGLPPETGLYASILPLMAYGLFGTSRALSVGPVAVVSLMTAAAIGSLGLTDPAQLVVAAAVLALLSGLMLLAMGMLRLGVLANFLSHPVIAGFITASGILIALSQAKHILGIEAHGHTLPVLITSLFQGLRDTNVPTLVLGMITLGFLAWSRGGLKRLLVRVGVGPQIALFASRAAPVLAVAMTTLAVVGLELAPAGVAIVGDVPAGLPSMSLPSLEPEILRQLLLPAALISIIGFVESISVAQTFAAKRRQRIAPDQELIGLGASNVASALSGGFPVTGGFSRSVVNFDAGARTPAAGIFTAIGIAVATLALTPWLFFLPKATLSATIIVAVLSLVDLSILQRAWNYSRVDFAAVATTIILTLGFGVEIGVSAGVTLSIALHLWKTARPHVAEVGRVPGTEHFRNILRHDVETIPGVVTLRIDESLYFANARFLEDLVLDRIAGDDSISDLVLQCTAINEVDLSALETLEGLQSRLADAGIRVHLSEVKGPVMDRLARSDFLTDLTGQVFRSQQDAFDALREKAADPQAAAE